MYTKIPPSCMIFVFLLILILYKFLVSECVSQFIVLDLSNKHACHLRDVMFSYFKTEYKLFHIN
jgi:hypothetical protein